MAIGVNFGMAYILINLYTMPVTIMNISKPLLYASIITILTGLVFYLSARVRPA